jgi:hypothetical protein
MPTKDNLNIETLISIEKTQNLKCNNANNQTLTKCKNESHPNIEDALKTLSHDPINGPVVR